MTRHTHTVATLEVTATTYDEIARQLRDAGYDDASQDDGTFDMTGIGLILLRCPRTERSVPDLPNPSERVTILEDFHLDDPTAECVRPVTLDAAGEQILDTALRRGSGAKAYSVPKDWWERFVAVRTEFRALERTLKAFPRYTVSWHARLSLEDQPINERVIQQWPR